MVLASFLVALVLFLAAATFTTVRGVGLWRDAKRSGGAFEAELAAFEERTARTEELLAKAETSSRDLEAALAGSACRRRGCRCCLGARRAPRQVRWLRAFLPL